MATLSWRQKEVCDALIEHRTACNLSHRAAGALVGHSNAWVSRLETGRAQLNVEAVRLLLNAYQVDHQEIDRLCALALTALKGVWWPRYERWLTASFIEYLTYEHEAASVWSVQGMFVPGLLQEESYLRHLLTTGPAYDPDRSDVDIAVRLKRQEHRLYGPDAIKIHAFLGMPVLYWQLGGPRVLLAQMKHLRALVGRENVSAQIIPYENPTALWSLDLFESGIGDSAVAFSETQWGNPIHEDPLEIRQARRGLDRLAAVALGTEESTEVIDNRIRELEQ